MTTLRPSATPKVSGYFYDETNGGSISFRDNTAHAAMGDDTVANTDFPRISGVMLRMCRKSMPASPEFANITTYHNTNGIWPEDCEFRSGPQEDGYYHIDNLIAAENVGAAVQFIASSDVKITNALFVESITGKVNSAMAPLSMQYGSRLFLESPTFANYTRGILFGNDIFVPWHSRFFVSNPKFINTDKSLFGPEESSILTTTDSLGLPVGTYFSAGWPELATPDCSRVDLSHLEDVTSWFRCPAEGYKYGFLTVRNGVSLDNSLLWNQSATNYITRSDGFRYSGSGPFRYGYITLLNTPYTYTLDSSPTAPEFIVTMYGADSWPYTSLNYTLVGIPLTTPPEGVFNALPNEDDDGQSLVASTPLEAANSLDSLKQSKATRYYYDSFAKRLWIAASEYRPVIVRK